MNNLREKIQAVLSTINTIDVGVAKPDGLVQAGVTYFGYELQESYQGTDFDKNYAMEVTLTGRLVRKDLDTEDTLSVIDTALEELKTKLKSMNFKYSYNDVSDYQDGFKKIVIHANAKYDEINKTLIL